MRRPRLQALRLTLKISDWHARQLPADKLKRLSSLHAKGARVIAVGDGVNDAPVLAGADVAIAVAGGAEIARASSDIVLAGGRLAALATARTIAQQTLAILHQNQRWALCYNLAAVPAAALGFVPPWLAALGMSLSSLLVILNALRIGRGVLQNPASERRAVRAGQGRALRRHEHRAGHAGAVGHSADRCGSLLFLGGRSRSVRRHGHAGVAAAR